MMRLLVYTDGSSCSTTKDAGIGLVFVANDVVLHEWRESLRGTNNYAELFAIQRGLEKTETTSGLCEGFDEVVVYSDSAVSIGKIKREENPARELFEKEVDRRWRALAALVKAELVAVEEGILTIEQALAPHALTASQRTVAEEAAARLSSLGGGLLTLPWSDANG